MDGEPASAAPAKRIAERNDVNHVAIHASADYLPCRDGDSGCRKANRQMFEVNRSGRGLRRWAEAGKALLAGFDDAARTDSNEVRREETRSFLRGLCVQPLVFNTENGLGRGRNRSPGLRLCLRCRAKERDREHQTGDDSLQPQILMKIFLR
jgi:hypothetical protein